MSANDKIIHYAINKSQAIRDVANFCVNHAGLTHAQKNGLMLYIDHLAEDLIQEAQFWNAKQPKPTFPGEHNADSSPVIMDNLPF